MMKLLLNSGWMNLLVRTVVVCTFSLLYVIPAQVLANDEPQVTEKLTIETGTGIQVASSGSLDPQPSPMMMLTFELDASYSEFVDMYRAKPIGTYMYFSAPQVPVIGMSQDGAFHALKLKHPRIGKTFKLLSDSRLDLDPAEFAAIADYDLKHALNFDVAECVFLYEADHRLLVTTFLTKDIIGGSSTKLPLFDVNGYLTARVPASKYGTFFRTLSEDCEEEASVYYERFGKTRKDWYEIRTSGNYPVFSPLRHSSFPFECPHMRWLVISGNSVKEKLVPLLQRAFQSHYLPGSVAWTSGIGAGNDAVQVPPTLLYQTYSVTFEPEFSAELIEPQQVVSTVKQWPSVLIGMYVVEGGNVQLVFFRGIEDS